MLAILLFLLISLDCALTKYCAHAEPLNGTLPSPELKTRRVNVSSTGPIERFQFRPDGTISGLVGGFVCTWDQRTGKELQRSQLPNEIDRKCGAIFSTTGETLYQAKANGSLISWTHKPGIDRSIQLIAVEPNRTHRRFWLSSDGTRFAEHADKSILVRDVATGVLVRRMNVPPECRSVASIDSEAALNSLGVLAFFAHGDRLALGRPKSPLTTQITLFGVREPSQEPYSIQVNHYASALSFSRDGRFLAAVGNDYAEFGFSYLNPLRISVWDSLLKKEVVQYSPKEIGIATAVKFSPDGRLLAVFLKHHRVLLLEIATGAVRTSLTSSPSREPDEYPSEFTRDRDAICWSHGGMYIATTEGGGQGLRIKLHLDYSPGA